LGLALCWLYATAVFEQGGMIHYGGTVYYLRYTISTSLSLRFTILVFTRAR